MRLAMLVLLVCTSTACALDVTAWNALLAKFVDANGLVNYPAWRADTASVAQLDQFLIAIGAENVGALAAADQQAFWVNTHNAFVVRSVLQRPAIKTPFDDPLFFIHTDYSAGGARISLQSVENDHVRAFKEPRLLFALTFGCKGGPRLRATAYAAADFPANLDQLVTDYLSDPDRTRYDTVTTTLILGEPFHWFLADFNGLEGVVSFVTPLAPPGHTKLLSDPELDVQFHINRTLNQQGF